jgi:hypothetical protein
MSLIVGFHHDPCGSRPQLRLAKFPDRGDLRRCLGVWDSVMSGPLRDIPRRGAYVAASLRPGSSAPSPVPATPQSDVMEQLRQLGSLRDAGVLTEDEFDAKKAELLRRI